METSYLETYHLDDLLVNATQEIILNGFDTRNLPEAIKEWVAGKLLKTLPKALLKRLLTLILDNREITNCVDFMLPRKNTTD